MYQFDYDAANQLIGAVLKNTSTGAILKQYGYTYDPVGNRTSEQIGNAVNSDTHNNLNQIISRQGGGKMRFAGLLSEPAVVTVGGSPATVTQSGSTNRFEGMADVTVGTNTVSVVAKGSGGIARTNRYQVVVSSGITQTLTYDPSGNLVSRSGGGSSTTYEWDAVNRLKAINSGTHRSEFTYDGYSRRVRIVEKDNGSVTSDKRLVWDGMQIAEERDGTGATVTKRYFPQGVKVSSATYYYTRDHLGSIREMTDSTGAIQARYDYDPYGRRTKVSGNLDADFGFTGHYHHAPSGLHLALYRAYDADLGRWLSRDPIGENGGINLYAYVMGDPISQSDPTGEFTLIQLLVVVTAITVAVGIIYGVAQFEKAVGKAIDQQSYSNALDKFDPTTQNVDTPQKVLQQNIEATREAAAKGAEVGDTGMQGPAIIPTDTPGVIGALIKKWLKAINKFPDKYNNTDPSECPDDD